MPKDVTQNHCPGIPIYDRQLQKGSILRNAHCGESQRKTEKHLDCEKIDGGELKLYKMLSRLSQQNIWH